MSDTTTKQAPDMNFNPSGKGGFGDHPENRSDGRWDPKHTFSYQMNRFKKMTLQELNDWSRATTPDIRTVAEDLAFRRVSNSRDKLDEFREVANRTEGMPKQPIEHSGKMTWEEFVGEHEPTEPNQA